MEGYDKVEKVEISRNWGQKLIFPLLIHNLNITAISNTQAKHAKW